MIGNDIIDLDVPISPNWNNSRYLNKLYSSAEQETIFNSDNPSKTLRLYWSLKEAAYKAHQRLFNLPRKYNPLDFHCEIITEQKNTVNGIVRINNQVYFTFSTITIINIHSIATLEKYLPNTFNIIPYEIDVKNKLFTEYSLLLNVPKSHLRILKNDQQIPQLYCNSLNTSQVFSISNHGKFHAYAISLMNC